MNQAAARGTAKPNILVVDDDRAILSAMGRGLREAGYAVREAATGIEALRFCTELAPDLAMLDITHALHVRLGSGRRTRAAEHSIYISVVA